MSSDVSQILNAIEAGDLAAASRLFPLVYDELRRMAAGQMAQESPGQSLQATALVHEAYVRLVEQPNQQSFANRSHFFGTAAEAMRRILVERARRGKASSAAVAGNGSISMIRTSRPRSGPTNYWPSTLPWTG